MMADQNAIHAYASKWYYQFQNTHIPLRELLDGSMLDEGLALGFEMDCGHAFCERYPQAFHDFEALQSVIGGITDIPLLGSAVISQYCYHTHWGIPENILNSENRIWFLIALHQLACLTGPDPRTEQDPYHFHGTLKRVRIVSENAGYGPVPPPDVEVEQRLTISDTGGVLFAAYTCNADGSPKKAREKRRKIDPAAAKTVLDAFAAVFQWGYDEIPPIDVGEWDLELKNAERDIPLFSKTYPGAQRHRNAPRGRGSGGLPR